MLAAIPPRLRRFAHYDVRRAEDAHALAELDAAAEHLDFGERVFAAPALRGFGAVFRALPAQGLAGLVNLVAMTGAIQELQVRHPDAIVLAPFGIGNHIDHVEVFLAALRLVFPESPIAQAESANRLWFYEDAYALFPTARRRHFVTGQLPLRGPSAPGSGMLRTWLAGCARCSTSMLYGAEPSRCGSAFQTNYKGKSSRTR